MFYKYDFGCQLTHQIEMTNSLNVSYTRQLFWRHGGLIRYGQMHLMEPKKSLDYLYLRIENNISLANIPSQTNFVKLARVVRKISNIFNDGKLLSGAWFRHGHESRHNGLWEKLSSTVSIKFSQLKIQLNDLKTDDKIQLDDSMMKLINQMENNILNFEKSRKQIILQNGGWHLSWFYNNRNVTHNLMTRKADSWINTKFNHKNLDCFIKHCVYLNNRKYGQRHYFKTNNYSYENYNYLRDFGISYPQWTVEKAFSDSNSFWYKMFPNQNTNFFIETNDSYRDQICQKQLVLSQ